MPRFSLVIPVYNRSALLSETLQSVLMQRLTDYEVLVVDDGSTDGSANVARGLDERVRVFEQRNRGPGAARNLALRHASGEYVVFLDSDDLWFPWSLEVLSEVIRRHNGPSLIAGCVRRFANVAELSSVSEDELRTLAFADYLASGDEWRWYGLSSFAAKRAVVEQVGGFAEEPINAEDADFAMRLGDAPGFIQVLAPATFGYREHAGGIRHEVERTARGHLFQLRQEHQGHYPGGVPRRLERWAVMSPHIRASSIGCLHSGLRREAWELYRRTFRWHIALSRWKYLAGFPLVAMWSNLFRHRGAN
jgi:glycosyltransferase involved in cell wall biosynthesis